MADKVKSIDEAMAMAQTIALKNLSKNKAPGLAVVPTTAAEKKPLLVPVVEWLKDVAPPTWVVEGIIQQGNLYALTAVTNHGKTAISLLMAMCIASGRRFCEKEIRPGGVLLLCGENPDGFRTRLRATLSLALGLDVEDVAGRVVILPLALPLHLHLDQIRAEAVATGIDFSLVIVDTSVTYFTGDDENDNLAARDHALDMRELTEIPGHPAVIANCHPTGSADRDNLRPRGGSAFLNEIDGNLTVWAQGETALLHWQRKKRGPDFDPMPFEFHGTTLEEMGIAVPTVVAMPITDERERELTQKRRESENRVLHALLHMPNGSIADWCASCGWDALKHKSKVHRILHRLKEDGLAKVHRGSWALTKPGVLEAESIR